MHKSGNKLGLDLQKSGNKLGLDLHMSGNELTLDLHKSGNELSLDLHKSGNELSLDLCIDESPKWNSLLDFLDKCMTMKNILTRGVQGTSLVEVSTLCQKNRRH